MIKEEICWHCGRKIFAEENKHQIENYTGANVYICNDCWIKQERC